jgi:hypothetical protein
MLDAAMDAPDDPSPPSDAVRIGALIATLC